MRTGRGLGAPTSSLIKSHAFSVGERHMLNARLVVRHDPKDAEPLAPENYPVRRFDIVAVVHAAVTANFGLLCAGGYKFADRLIVHVGPWPRIRHIGDDGRTRIRVLSIDPMLQLNPMFQRSGSNPAHASVLLRSPASRAVEVLLSE